MERIGQGRVRGVGALAAWVVPLFLAACATTRAPTVAEAYFVLMRHGEKASDDPRDPSLSADGQARALRIATHLADAPLTAVYATAYRRTQLTAQPAAQAHGLQTVTYDANEPAAALAARLRAAHRSGTVLVVGHSNTVPALASALCACDAPPLAETDYGRVYRLKVPAQGAATLELQTW